MQKGTFNTIARNSTSVGGGKVVWARVTDLYQGGGEVDTASMQAGDVIPAGTPVVFAGAGKKVTIITDKNTETQLANVNGLTYEDVCIPDGVICATVAVVRAGRIYADRVGAEGLDKSLVKQLPMIEFVYES